MTRGVSLPAPGAALTLFVRRGDPRGGGALTGRYDWRPCGAGAYGPGPPRSAAPSWVGASASGSVYWIQPRLGKVLE